MSYPETLRRRSSADETARRAEQARIANEARQNELRSQRDRAGAQADATGAAQQRTAGRSESPADSGGESLFDRMRRRAVATVSPALQTAANAVGGVRNALPLGLDDASRGTQDGFDPNRAVQQLNSDGDRAYLRITAEAKGEIPIPTPAGDAVKAGLKGQYGNDIAITQNGDGADATFTVRTERHSLAAIIGSVGIPGTENAVKGERGVQTYDAVEMTFATREEAARAAGIMQRIALADLGSDAAGLAMSAPGPANPGATASQAGGNPVTGGSNPLANPLTESGAPGEVTERAAGVSAEDRQFLEDHITAYEQTLNTRDRLALELKMPELFPGQFVQPGVEGRLDGRIRVTRRVELPTDDTPGSVTYTSRQDVRLSAKEKLLFDVLPTEPAIGGIGVENRIEIGRAEVAISARFELPPGVDITQSPVGGRHLPEIDLLREGDFQPDRITAEINTDFRTQGPTDLSRGDGYRGALRLEINDPGGAPEALGHFVRGDAEAAAEAAGARITGEIERVERTGVNVQAGPKFKVGFSAEVTAILESGIDDVTGVRRFTIEPRPDQAQAPGPGQPEAPQPTLVVVPRDGLTLRDAPAGERTSVFQNGTFLTQTGEAVADAEGRQWIPVSGTDVSDAQVAGFVQADYTRPHDGALGAMDATGRTNPTLANQRYDTHQVVQDDNLWDLSRKLGIDFDEMLALNRDHIIAPELIFAGDTVYIPGTARGPAPPAAEPPPPPTEDTTSSLTTESEGTLSPEDGSETGWTMSGGTEPSTASPGQPGWHPPLVPVPGPNGPTISPQGGGSSTMSPGGTGGGDPTLPTPVAEVRPDPGADPAAPPVAAQQNRPDLAQIERDYQYEGDPGERIDWRPVTGGLRFPGFVEDAAEAIAGRQTSVPLLPSEVAWLDRLNAGQQIEFARISDDAMARARANYQMPDTWQGNLQSFANDGHLDAFRHTYWAARLTREYGADWARGYLAAHEADPTNEARREAMDGYNNELGVQLALDNPNATPAELERLAREAVSEGRTVVIDGGGNLAWSDQVPVGGHGAPPRVQAPGVIPVPVPGDTQSPG